MLWKYATPAPGAINYRSNTFAHKQSDKVSTRKKEIRIGHGGFIIANRT